MLAVLTRERLSWVLSLFYFLTFGGFVAFAIYLPTLLRDEFGLTPADAGFRTAGFVALATLLRPVGGWLSDQIGGARVLSGVFLRWWMHQCLFWGCLLAAAITFPLVFGWIHFRTAVQYHF